ncbi:hypothetical protein WJX73_001667 [Symbiochloris irregularis]|uniref:Uncharacterized protein n=1 Tax=Symbiochloris irregularis TaxID=706552 RepID=A0AAW1NNK2_9CHLO
MGKKSRRREKEPEHVWPAMSREELLTLLHQMRIDTDLLGGQADTSRLSKLLGKALRLGQTPCTSLPDCDLDPGSLPSWGELDREFHMAFFMCVGSLGEILLPRQLNREMHTNAWFRFRTWHAGIAYRLLEGEPLLEVIFSSILGDRRGKGLHEMEALMIPHTDDNSGIPYIFPVSVLEVLLMKQMLEANAARSDREPADLLCQWRLLPAHLIPMLELPDGQICRMQPRWPLQMCMAPKGSG